MLRILKCFVLQEKFLLDFAEISGAAGRDRILRSNISRIKNIGEIAQEESCMLYIGIDLGTSAVKLLLMKEDGTIENIVSKEYPLFFPHPGW